MDRDEGTARLETGGRVPARIARRLRTWIEQKNERKAFLRVEDCPPTDAAGYEAFQLLTMIGTGLHERGGFTCRYDLERIFG